jgi:hypothetical protein
MISLTRRASSSALSRASFSSGVSLGGGAIAIARGSSTEMRMFTDKIIEQIISDKRRRKKEKKRKTDKDKRI